MPVEFGGAERCEAVHPPCIWIQTARQQRNNKQVQAAHRRAHADVGELFRCSLDHQISQRLGTLVAGRLQLLECWLARNVRMLPHLSSRSIEAGLQLLYRAVQTSRS